MQPKLVYFQGTEEPTPGNKQYKSDKAITVQPRFKEPFYRNYDIYQTEGVNGEPKHSPGSGYHALFNYKSVADFLKDRRRKLQDKYKADDSWIEDTRENREERIRRMRTRAKLFSKFIKIAIDFIADEQGGTNQLMWDMEAESGTGILGNSVYWGGFTDPYLPPMDFEGKRVDNLNFGRDYEGKLRIFDEDKLHALMEKYLNAKEPPPLGLPDGMSPPDDLDPVSTIQTEQPFFGTTDMGITVYEDKWNI